MLPVRRGESMQGLDGSETVLTHLISWPALCAQSKPCQPVTDPDSKVRLCDRRGGEGAWIAVTQLEVPRKKLEVFWELKQVRGLYCAEDREVRS